MITFATEPGVYTDFIPGEQFPGLPGGVRFPALVGEARTFILRENVRITKSGLLSFSYNAQTGKLTTSSAHGPEDILDIVVLRKNGLDFELVTPGDNQPTFDLSDISLAAADFTQVRVGGAVFIPTPVAVNHPINITAAGYSVPTVTIRVGDTITWTNTDTLAHGIQNDVTSSAVFTSAPAHIGPTASFSTVATTFTAPGVYNYFDPLLPQDTLFQGTIVVNTLQGYTYDEPTRTIGFTQEVQVGQNMIEVDTEFATSSVPVTIRIDGRGRKDNYDLNVAFTQIQQILKVQLQDVADPLPEAGVTEIVKVGNTASAEDYSNLDYLLVNDTIDWGAAVSKAKDVVAGTSIESFVDKVFVEVGTKLEVPDDQWLLTVVSVGAVGVGTYSIRNLGTNTLVGTFTTSAGFVPTNPIPGVNLTVTETTGTTIGDTVIITTNAGTLKEPNAGDTYFVTYKVRKTDLRPKLMFRFADIKKEYGNTVSVFNPDGTIKKLNNLVLGAFLSLINGAPGIICTQTDFGTDGNSTSTDFIDAIDKLKEIDEVGTVVPLTSDSIVRGFVQTHVNEASGRDFRRERMAFVSAPPGSSIEELIAMGKGISDKRVALVTPTAATTEIQDDFGHPLLIAVEGFFLAAAMAGLSHSLRFDVAEPLTRKRIVGFRTLEGEFLKPEKDRLSENGVLVIQTIGGVFSIRQSITTSTNSIEEREISITKITDFVAIASRAACDRFIGTKLLDETPIWIEAALANVLQSLVSDRIISGFGGVSASVDPNRPDSVTASYAFKPVYALNYITIVFTINSRL